MLFFHNIASWCVPDRRVGSIADSRRRHFLSGAGLEPFGPIAPPAAVVFFRAGQPRRRRPGRRRIAGFVGPGTAFACGRRVDHARDVPTRRKYETRLRTRQLRYPPSRAPWDDVVPLGADRVDVLANKTQIDRLIEKRDLSRLDQVVLEIGVMEIEAVRRGDHTGAIVVPIEQIEGGRLVPHEIAVGERVPDQVVGAQKIEPLLSR